MSDYDTDFYAWTRQQAQALRAKDWTALDVEHLAEEVTDLGDGRESAIESQLERLLFHLLKLAYDPNPRPRRGWRVSVASARREIAKVIRRNPSLRGYPAQYLPEAYRGAQHLAAIALDRPVAAFPEACPWPVEQVLEEDFWPPEAPPRLP